MRHVNASYRSPFPCNVSLAMPYNVHFGACINRIRLLHIEQPLPFEHSYKTDKTLPNGKNAVDF